MWRFLFLLLIGIFCLDAGAQSDFTGKYGYQESRASLRERFPGIRKDEYGYFQSLILIKLNKQQYRFFLYVNKGYKNYASGGISDTIHFEGNQAFYQRKENADGIACQLTFQVSNRKVFVSQGEENCGFGAYVIADGDYNLQTRKPGSRDLAEFTQKQPHAYRIAVQKAIIYKDEEGSQPTRLYFIEKDIVYSVEDFSSTIFFRHISPKGIYLEGYLRKSDLKANPR